MRNPYYLLDPFFYIKEVSPDKKNSLKRSSFDWKRILKKVLSAPYTGILFPGDLIKNPDLPLFIKETEENNLKPVIQAHVSLLKTQNLKHFFAEQKHRLGLNIILHNPETFEKLQENIKTLPASSYLFTWLVLKTNKTVDLSKTLPEWILKNTEIYFPYKNNLHDPFLTPREVYRYIKKYKPFLTAQPYTGDIYDDRIGLDKDLEPITKPFAENKLTSEKTMDFSIIIPSYNNKTQLINTLEKLTEQTYKKEQFEIIVIDDGSTEGTFSALKKFIDCHKNNNFTALHFPRVKPRTPGDAGFRAGIARNLGVKYASGKYLAFLDGDILVPPDYLIQLKTEHEQADLVQLKRYHLKKNIPLKEFFFDHDKLKSFIFIEDKRYWGTFYKKGFKGMTSPWKYTCTYGLSLLKKEFLEQGCFGKTFLYYGFEDTDLGYRLFKSGKKLLLSNINCYHQFVSGSRREDRKNPSLRNRLLSKTAKIFFYRHLDPMIFEELKAYMGQERGFRYFFPPSFTD